MYDFRRAIRDLAAWMSLKKRYFERDRQFVPISFPRSVRQVVHDKRDDTVLQFRIRPRTKDWPVFQLIFVSEEYRLTGLKQASALHGFYDSLVCEGSIPLVLDCGANNGLSSAWFAKTYPNAFVLGVEPEPGNFALAVENTAALRNVAVINAAVAANDCTVELHDPGRGTSSYQTKVGFSGGGVPAFGVQSLISLAQEKCSTGTVVPFVTKIDIEGFEETLFSESTDWIDHTPLIIIELHDWLFPEAGTAATFLQAVGARRRDFVFRGENVFSIQWFGS